MISSQWRWVSRTNDLGSESPSDPGKSVYEVLDTLFTSFLPGIAKMSEVPHASDLCALLEAIESFSSQTRLFHQQYHGKVLQWQQYSMNAIFSMILNPLFTVIFDHCVQCLYTLAATNWSYFLLEFIPQFCQSLPGKVDVSCFGVEDLDLDQFASRTFRFSNDILFHAL